MADLRQEINRRRTFAIISHPDAGKTTLTEKFLLYGGAIQTAGSVKGKQTDKHAVSDWMELEKQRGISVTSSVMQFEYEGYCINILDTPGHQDFSEDTYRTLMAADSAVMVIDAAKGIEPQTRKLFRVCAARNIPIFTFINKLDREARDPFDLLDELETEFGIGTYPMNWPISCGQTFKGVYDREKKCILTFETSHGGRERLRAIECDINDREKLDGVIGSDLADELCEQIDLIDGAGFDFDIDKVRCGKLSPVFFGSALNNFGIEPFLESFLKMTTAPLVRQTVSGDVDPFDEHFSALDIAVVDTIDGGVDVIKLGASSSFILRKSAVEVLKSTSPPVGVVDKINPTTARHQLYDGDMMILASDGVVDALGENGVIEAVDEAGISNPQTLADRLLDRALGKGAEDDCTILVFRLVAI